jgi:hypothetical protein
MRQFLYFVIFQSLLLLCSEGRAYNYGVYPGTRLTVSNNLYSGEKGKSFAEASVGYGGGVSIFLDGSYFVPFFGFNLGMITGRQAFQDSVTLVTSTFTYYSATTQIGIQVFPIERRTKGFNVYFEGVGIAGYNFVALSNKVTLTSIPSSDQSFSAGYGLGIGTEWIINDESLDKWALSAGVLFKNESATLFKQKFNLNSMSFSVGLGW